MTTQFIFIVTEYGCNSTPSDMWTPISKLFTNYEEAYAYFLKIAPPTDKGNIATQYINTSYNPNSTSVEYIVIRNICEDPYHAKRPNGAVIARYGLI
jgi:hypothetical protein